MQANRLHITRQIGYRSLVSNESLGECCIVFFRIFLRKHNLEIILIKIIRVYELNCNQINQKAHQSRMQEWMWNNYIFYTSKAAAQTCGSMRPEKSQNTAITGHRTERPAACDPQTGQNLQEHYLYETWTGRGGQFWLLTPCDRDLDCAIAGGLIPPLASPGVILSTSAVWVVPPGCQIPGVWLRLQRKWIS